jgi:hypothetical protein
MKPETVSVVVKEKTSENRTWLRGLTEPQLRSLACQRGICKWTTLSTKALITQLSQELDIQEPVKV